jgi:hypothetical protein
MNRDVNPAGVSDYRFEFLFLGVLLMIVFLLDLVELTLVCFWAGCPMSMPLVSIVAIAMLAPTVATAAFCLSYSQDERADLLPDQRF